MKYGNKANARKVDAPAMSSEASVANNFLRGVISAGSLTKNYRSVQRCNNLLSESMLTNSPSGVNHRYFIVAVGQREIVYATLPSKLKSKCTPVKGKMILSSSSWSITPDFRSIVTSRCTALKSRFNRLDSSLIDIEPAPAIVFMIFNRLGASIVLVRDSISWNDIENGTLIASPARAADIAILFFSQDSSWDITCTTNVFMLLPPDGYESFYFSEKIINQIFTSEGSCFFNQSFNAASMRVCQPRPVDLKASITSGEYRTDVSFFTGLADIGLPRRMILLPLLSVAVAKKSSSSSGASSGSIQVFFESFNFAFISFPHRDNATRFIALRPDHNNKPRVQFTYGDLPRFSIVLPIIFTGKMKPCKDLSSSGEIKPALKQGTISFVLVIFNFHNFIVATINGKSNVDPKIFSLYTVLAVAKSTAGIGTPFVIRALNRASGFFMGEAQLHLLFVVIMVGRAGEPQGSPGSLMTGSSNPVRLTTHEIGTSSGELLNLSSEDAIMATIPTQTQPKTPNIYVSDIDLERRTHEINLLLGCASFLACNATQEAKRCLVDILVIIGRLTQELISLTQDAKYRANTPPATSRRRGRK